MILKKISENFPSWTNSTKEEHPSRNTFGYNAEENRLEFYIKLIDTWFFLWSEYIAITPSPLPPYFLENFEVGWFINNIFSQLFVEDLETGWFIYNIFTQLFTEDFETNWFINNIFNQLFVETFEGGW